MTKTGIAPFYWKYPIPLNIFFPNFSELATYAYEKGYTDTETYTFTQQETIVKIYKTDLPKN